MSDESFRRNQGADPGLPRSDTGKRAGQYDCPPLAGDLGEPLQEPWHQVKFFYRRIICLWIDIEDKSVAPNVVA